MMHRYPPALRAFRPVAMGRQSPAFWEGAIAAVQGLPYVRGNDLDWCRGHNAYMAGSIRSKKLLRLAGVA